MLLDSTVDSTSGVSS